MYYIGQVVQTELGNCVYAGFNKKGMVFYNRDLKRVYPKEHKPIIYIGKFAKKGYGFVGLLPFKELKDNKQLINWSIDFV